MQNKKALLVDLNRRRFLQNATASVAGATCALSMGRSSWNAFAQSQATRPRMINIHVPAGWDTNWFHMAEPKDSFGEFNPNLVAGLPPGLKTSPDTGEDPYGRRVTPNAEGTAINEFFHGAYTERTLRSALIAHPTAAGHWAGLGMSHAYGSRLNTVLANTCIWKGIASGGQHSIPNKNIIHGSESQYAISYSGLIAEALAQRHGKLKLHYVQLCARPSDFGSNWAMAKGDQIPINIADYPSFKQLTSKVAGDFQSRTLFESLNASISRLGSAIEKERLSLRRSKEIFDEFMRFFTGTLEIAALGSNMSELLTIWADYANVAREKLAGMHDRSFLEKVSPEVSLPFQNATYNFHLYSPYQPLPRRGETTAVPNSEAPAFNKALLDGVFSGATLSTPFEATEASLAATGTTALDGAGLRRLIASVAWRFAMADFLVTKGFSNVVDIVVGNMDGHASNSAELRLLTLIYSLHGRLIERLQQTSLLDQTLLTMFSEFDRSQALLTEISMLDRGTAHGGTESILLTGYGVKKGTVFGNRFFDANGRPTDNPAPVSINGAAPATLDYKYPFPTILEIFKVKVPENQITDAVAVRDILA
jgi:hypothetical protein